MTAATDHGTVPFREASQWGSPPQVTEQQLIPSASLDPGPLRMEPGLDAQVAAYLHNLSVPQLVCLAYGHRWPELIPGMPIPKGFHAVRSADLAASGTQLQGVYRVSEDCTREIKLNGSRRRGETCGTSRSSMTLPRGFFDKKVDRQYGYDHDVWEVRPEGSGLSRRDFTEEIYRRMGRDLFPAEYGQGPAS